MDYLQYWGLKEKPFESNNDPEYFYESYDHIEALERLFYIVEEGNMNFGMLTGEIGCGKTMTRLVFKKRLSPIKYEVIDMENSNIPFNFILLECIERLRVGTGLISQNIESTQLYYLLKEFTRLLKIKVIERKRQLVIILDEAQQLTPQSLIELKNLTNITFNNQSYITIILVGQPELRDIVKSLPQIDQRISLRYHLNPLSERDIEGYLKYRLKVAGHVDGNIFDKKVPEVLCQATGGIPREINRICKLALDRAFSLQKPYIDAEIIKSIVADLNKHGGRLYGGV